MEEELRCPACKQFFNNTVLLPCYHALCLNCALHLQQAASQVPAPGAVNGALGAVSTASGSLSDNISNDCSSGSSASSASSGGVSCGNNSTIESNDLYQEVDKLSIVSETDSGVVCNSRPNSYVGTPNLQGVLLFPPLTTVNCVLSLSCPVCSKLVYFDENGAHNLPKYRIMQNIVDKYTELKQVTLKCQMCEGEAPDEATVLCEQCDVLYCERCREIFHPSRGPLAKHALVEAVRGAQIQRYRASVLELNNCPEHDQEPLSMYCMVCKVPVCAACLHDTRHTSHDVQAINSMCKAQKTELSQNLQQLSEKARSTTEFIQRLKSMSDKVNDKSLEFEALVSAQCDALQAAIEARKLQLLEAIRQDKDTRLRALKEQVSACTGRLQQTTGLLQFCIEALKETDSTAFLQVGSMLITRVANTDITWHKNMQINCPRVSPNFDLTLDDKAVIRAIDQLNFIQMKPPSAPTIILEECSAENNSVTVAWQPPAQSYVEGYVLELDDGNNGEFREVYCGTETICTVDGLHFHSQYNARVKAFNSSGEGEYSELIGLQTAEVAWFTFDPLLGPGLQYSEDNQTVCGDGWEHRVALGSVGFSRGIHYWEFTVNKFDVDTDPAFGIARIDVARDKMLGKDDKGWAMYIDRQRSWFQYNGSHERRVEGGIHAGGTVGVLLDLDRHTLTFYVNEIPQGGVAFRNLYGVFYPAVSVNRGVSLTLHTAIDAPSDVEDSP